MSPKYHHLTSVQRYSIDSMQKSKYSLRKIADVLDVNVSTISREAKRNSGVYRYHAHRAELLAIKRRRMTRKSRKITVEVAKRICELLAE